MRWPTLVTILRRGNQSKNIDSPNCEMPHAKTASSLMKIIQIRTSRVNLAEQKASLDDRFLRGRQTAFMTYETFRVTGTHEAGLDYSDLFGITFHDDDVQGFETRLGTKFYCRSKRYHKSLIYGDSLKAKMQSLDDEKVALLAAKRQFLPLQSRIEKQKNYLERISREIETKQQHRLEILQKWIEADQELDAAHAKQVQAKHEMSILVAEQTAVNAKAVNQGTSGVQSLSSPSNPDSDAQQTILSVFKSVLSMQNMGCHSVAEQLMAAGATDEEVKKISLDHVTNSAETGRWE